MASRKDRWERGVVNPVAVKTVSDKYFTQTCFQAESLKDLAVLNIESLVSYVSLQYAV